PQSSEDAVADDAGKKTNKEPANEVALDNLLVHQKKGYANNTNRDSTISPSVSATGQSFTNADNLPTDPLMLDLEDTTDLLNTGIFSGAYDDEWKVWRLVDLPKGKHAIGTKWVYRNKKDERGIVVRNKARLVAQGYTQEEGIDYDEVFAPVARIKVIRLFLAYASFMGFIMYQMDMKSAFLYGTIKEEVYVCQPPGFEDPQFPDKVYKCFTLNPALEIRHHFISEDSYGKKLIQVIKIHTDHNVADLLTEAFDVSRFNFLIDSIGLLNL
ncbi:putative ribonuclease H-like domain-containing protein, partial [Tanacetum coccineum]